MTQPTGARLPSSHISFSIGYGLICCWAVVLLFSERIGAFTSTAVTTYSMLSGAIACIGSLACYGKMGGFHGRSLRSFALAFLVAAGTFLYSFPAISEIPGAGFVGTLLSGLFTILLLMEWFEVFSRMSGREIVLWSGLALLVGSLASLAIIELPAALASIAVTVIPLASWAFLPSPSSKLMAESLTKTEHQEFHGSHGPLEAAREAVPTRTLLGIVITFFVIGALGFLSESPGRFTQDFDFGYLSIPLAMTLFFVTSALVMRSRVDTSTLYKLLMVFLAGLGFLLVNVTTVSVSFLYFTYVTSEVLLWMVLAISSRKTPVQAYSVFALGWLAECLGNVLGHNAAAALADPVLISGLIALLILIAVGFAFGDGVFVIELEDEEDAGVEARTSEREPGNRALAAMRDAASLEGSSSAAASAPGEKPDPVSEFVSQFGLSKREKEVFALWVTGHGLKHIENALYISEATVKSHLRNIYRKCDTHSRAEIIDLYEKTSARP